MVGHALLQIAVLLVLTQVPASAALFEMKPSDLGNSLHDTIIFTTFVAMQWFNLFNCRSVDEEWSPFADFQSSKFAMVRASCVPPPTPTHPTPPPFTLECTRSPPYRVPRRRRSNS
jgi:magnesium-transporting ATPase (P-type)